MLINRFIDIAVFRIYFLRQRMQPRPERPFKWLLLPTILRPTFFRCNQQKGYEPDGNSSGSMLIDLFIPKYDVTARYGTVVDSSPESAHEAAHSRPYAGGDQLTGAWR